MPQRQHDPRGGDALNTAPLQPPRWLALALVICGALAIGVAALRPAPELAGRIAMLPITCLVCGDVGGTDVALNLLLFAPFASGVALLGLRPGRILALAALTSLTIETIQFAWLPGRDPSVSDLLTNTLGATITGWLVHRRAILLLPNRRQAARLTVVALSAWTLLEAVAAWSLAPSLPETVYWGQWAPDLGHLDRFRGTVLGAAVAGDSLPPHRLNDSARLRQRLLGGGPIMARAITGSPPLKLAPIVSVFDGHSTEVLLLGQRRAEAIFRLRMRVSDLRLRPPAISLQDAVPVAPGDSLAISADYLKGRYSLRVRTGERTIDRTIDATPNWAWSYFMPFENYALGRTAPWLTALWVIGLLLPIGYWAGRTGTPLGLVGACATVALTLAVIPGSFDLPVLHLSEWLAALAGLLLGYLAAQWHTGG